MAKDTEHMLNGHLHIFVKHFFFLLPIFHWVVFFFLLSYKNFL